MVGWFFGGGGWGCPHAIISLHWCVARETESNSRPFGVQMPSCAGGQRASSTFQSAHVHTRVDWCARQPWCFGSGHAAQRGESDVCSSPSQPPPSHLPPRLTRCWTRCARCGVDECRHRKIPGVSLTPLMCLHIRPPILIAAGGDLDNSRRFSYVDTDSTVIGFMLL